MFARSRLLAPAAGVAAGAVGLSQRSSMCESSVQPGYRLPPPSIVELADAKPVPAASIQPKLCEKVVYLQRTPMLTLEDVTAPVLKLAGARFNPCTLVHHGTHGPDLYWTSMAVQDVAASVAAAADGGGGAAAPVASSANPQGVDGLPDGARISHAAWSPDGRSLAFALRTEESGDDAACRLWMLDVESATARPVQPEQRLNSVLGPPFIWLPDSATLIVKRPIGTRADEPAIPSVPCSPTVQVGGRAAVAHDACR